MRNNSLHNYLFLSALSAVAVSAAWADTVYKSTDKQGHTTYSSQPPSTPAEKSKTVEMQIDPNQNVLPVEHPQIPAYQNQRPSENNTVEQQPGSRAEAEAALREAEQALEAGKETQPGDFIGRSGRGVGPSQQRIERINELQDAVDRAKAALDHAGGGN
jgi:uncharacterized iron-regulated membrane protein